MSKIDSESTRASVRAPHRSLPQCIATTFLAALLSVVGVSAFVPTDSTWAEDNAEERTVKKRGRRNFVLTPLVFKRMSEIHELMLEEKFSETLPLLEQLADRRRLSAFEKATIDETFGFSYSALAQYDKAAESFERALASDYMPEGSLSNMRFNLAQLYVALEEFEKAIEHLDIWLASVTNPSANAYYLMGAAHAQLKQTKEALPYIVLAVEKSGKFKESWLQLLLALHFELKHYQECARVLTVLIEHAPKKAYLQQLQGVYSELGYEKKALAVLELSYLQGFIDGDNELRNLSHLYLYHEIPGLAVKVMEEGLANGLISEDREAWELLGDSLLHAREYARALAPLSKAAEMAETGDVYLKIARMHLEDQDWSRARRALEAALTKGKIGNPGEAQLMLGISNAKLERFAAAREAFNNAAESNGSKKSAVSWLKHLDELEAAAAS